MFNKSVLIAGALVLASCEWFDALDGTVGDGEVGGDAAVSGTSETPDAGTVDSGLGDASTTLVDHGVASHSEPPVTAVDAWSASTAATNGMTIGSPDGCCVGGSSTTDRDGSTITFATDASAALTDDLLTSNSTERVATDAEVSAVVTNEGSAMTSGSANACPGGFGAVTFSGPLDVSDGLFKGPSAMVAADFNRDGLPDIAAMGESSTKLEWFEAPRERGAAWARHGLPAAPVTRPFLGSAKSGDVNGDGEIDLVASIDNHSNAEKSAYVYWWENPGARGSDAWTVHHIHGPLDVHHINDMELEDMDRDGKLDVVVRSLDGNALHLFFQDVGGWSLRTLDARPFGKQGEGFALGQLDGARGIDIAICGYWLESPDDPRVDDFVTHTIDAEYCAINANVKQAVGDIDEDGRMDVLVSPAEGARDGADHVLAWYQGPTDPRAATSWKQTVIEAALNGVHTARLGDVDNDGDLDVLAGIAWDKWGHTRRITLYYNDGSGAFPGSQTVSASEGLYTGVFIDLGADGDLDIVGQGTYAGNSRPDMYESTLCDDASAQ